MKLQYILLIALIALGLSTCTPGGSRQSYIPPTQTKVASHSKPDAGYIYVTDRIENELLVYPQDVSNPSPIRTVSFDAPAPWSVATDSDGNVFVTNWEYPRPGYVEELSPGATSVIGKFSDPLPVMITLDSGNIYVAGGDSVRIYSYSSSGRKHLYELTKTVPLLVNGYDYGVLGGVSFFNGNIYVVAAPPQGGAQTVVVCSVSSSAECTLESQIQTIQALGGLAITNTNYVTALNWVVATVNGYSIYNPVSMVGQYSFGLGNTVRAFTYSPESNLLYVPLDTGDYQKYGPGAVQVIETYSYNITNTIQSGIAEPVSVAIGPPTTIERKKGIR